MTRLDFTRLDLLSFVDASDGTTYDEIGDKAHEWDVEVGGLEITPWGRRRSIWVTPNVVIVRALSLPAILSLNSEGEQNDAELAQDVLVCHIEVVLD